MTELRQLIENHDKFKQNLNNTTIILKNILDDIAAQSDPDAKQKYKDVKNDLLQEIDDYIHKTTATILADKDLKKSLAQDNPNLEKSLAQLSQEAKVLNFDSSSSNVMRPRA